MEILFTTLNVNGDIDTNAAKIILKLQGFKKQFDFEKTDDSHGSENEEVYANQRFADIGITASKFQNPASELVFEQNYIFFIEEVQKDLISYDLKSYEEATIGDIVDYILNCNNVSFLGHKFVDASYLLKSLYDFDEIEDESESESE